MPTPTSRQPRRTQRPAYRTDAGGAIIITTADDFRNAIEKAKKVRPLVRVECFGHYKVRKQEAGAQEYDVHLWSEGGERKGKCSCAAGTPPVEEGKASRAPRACYHLMAAIPRHLQLALERRSQQARPQPQEAGGRGAARWTPPQQQARAASAAAA